MPECPAPGPGHGHGWLWQPQSAPALPFHAQEDRGRDELRLPPGSPHGFGAPLPGRRKVMGLFQRQISVLISISSISLFFFNIIWMHQGVFCWKRDSCCLHALLKVPFLIPPKYFVLLWFLEGKLKDSDFFPTDIPWALPTPPLLLFSVLCTLTSLFTARTIGKAFVGILFPSAESSSYKRQMMDFYQKNQFLEVLH